MKKSQRNYNIQEVKVGDSINVRTTGSGLGYGGQRYRFCDVKQVYIGSNQKVIGVLCESLSNQVGGAKMLSGIIGVANIIYIVAHKKKA